IQLSRAAFETNVSLFFIVAGVWFYLTCFVAKTKKSGILLSVSGICFGLAMFTYQNARIFVPLLVICLLFIYRKQLIKMRRALIGPTAVSVIFLLVLIPTFFSGGGQVRFNGISVFIDPKPQLRSQQLAEEDKVAGVGFGSILHNQRFAYIPQIIQNYFVHFNPEYLFFTADADTHHAPQVGLLYLWDLPFIVAGGYFLYKNKYPKEAKKIITVWFLLAAVGSSLTWEVPHALRTEIYLPTYQIFAAIGLFNLLVLSNHKKVVFVTLGTLLSLNFFYYIYQYFVHLPTDYSKAWFYGRAQAAQATEEIKSKYDKVVVSTSLQQPYMFWLYNVAYDPARYLQEGGTVSGGFAENNNHFEKYEFRQIDYENEIKYKTKILWVGTPKDFPTGVNIVKTIYYLNGEKAIIFVSHD
ncbi:hypothetical protein HY024_05240, partial [Candidatus Curtissbacteria bacterium]|nr:hypothetical protein [Candidatus Curtissbacteria bacterium]